MIQGKRNSSHYGDGAGLILLHQLKNAWQTAHLLAGQTSSQTVSASWPASRKTAATSTGRFSSVLNSPARVDDAGAASAVSTNPGLRPRAVP